jgi:transcriptional regulator with XRE-family HTH domain
MLHDVASILIVTGRELRKQRLRLGLTQAQLATRLGLNRMSISRYENGLWPIPKHVALAVKALLVEAGLSNGGRD